MSEPGRQNRYATFLKIVVPVVLVIGSVGVARTLIANRPEPQRQEHEERGLLVEVQTVERASHRLDVSAEGTVVAAREVVVSPQVTGRTTWVAESLAPGGLVAAGDELVRIETRDFELAIDLRRAELERAEAGLALERGRQVVASREWEMFADELPDDPNGRSLALREPQIRDAEQAVELAETRLSQARLERGRTSISAPFNAFVEEEAIEIGQVIGPQSRVATLVGTDEYWVRVAVPVERLEYLDIPGVNALEGSRAVVWQDLGENRVEREGVLVRLLPDLDPQGRMARVLVRLNDPLRLARPPHERGVPLLIRSFVNVTFEGNTTAPLVEVPRLAVRHGDEVFVMTSEHTLEVRELNITWGRPDTVLVSAGLESGDQIVTSRIGTAVPGMLLRTPEDAASAEVQARAEGTEEGADEPRAE